MCTQQVVIALCVCVWGGAFGIVPCVSKIDTLGLFLSLLKEKLN
jgi:hypothetical protein